MCVLFILSGEEDFCFMAENQENYIVVWETFTIFEAGNRSYL